MSKRPGGKGDGGKKKDKQQAASLARRMAGKKGQTTQLQTEVNNEEDWEKLLQKEGLIVIDVYSDWSGPCVGMIGNLKKAKVEFGGDYLHLAIAKNDEIDCLARFRNRSEPTWLFSAGGLLLNCTFGANAPKLMKMIEAEMKQELKVMKGETWRHGSSFYDLCEEEKERAEAEKKRKTDAERAEEEKKKREMEEKRMKVYASMAEYLKYETIVICLPHTIDPEWGCVIAMDLDLFWRSQMMYVAVQYKTVITQEILEEIFFRGGVELTDDLLEDLQLGPCVVQLVKCQIIAQPGQEGERNIGDIELQITKALNGQTAEPEQEWVVPSPNSIPGKYPYIKKTKQIVSQKEEEEEEEEEEVNIIEEITSVPACWTPSNYITKCAAVRYLFPSRAEKVMTPEEPPIPPKVVIAFDTMKHKECFDLMEEYEEGVLNAAFFTSVDPAVAEPLCATPEQYAKLPHNETDKIVFVVKKVKSEPLLSFAGLGACYVSANEEVGVTEADMFFPPGQELRFPKLEEAERAQVQAVEEEPEEEVEEPAAEEEEEEQDEDDLMALLGVVV